MSDHPDCEVVVVATPGRCPNVVPERFRYAGEQCQRDDDHDGMCGIWARVSKERHSGYYGFRWNAEAPMIASEIRHD